MNRITISLYAIFHNFTHNIQMNSKVSLGYRIFISAEIGSKVVNRIVLIYMPLLNNNKL